MTQHAVFVGKFPKSVRLLRRRDFRFEHYKIFQGTYFTFVYNLKGQGRIGISITKRVLKRATARNRVRRLLKETFRSKTNKLIDVDVHVIGKNSLLESWSFLKRQDVDREFETLISTLPIRKG